MFILAKDKKFWTYTVLNNDFTYYLLALSRIKNLGSIRQKKLLQAFPHPKEIFKAPLKDLSRITGENIAREIRSANIFDEVDKEMKFIENQGIKILTIFDESYPHLLKHTPDAPVFLFKKGHFNFNRKRYLSVVGTRKNTSYGRQFVKDFIASLKDYNPVIVSGMAYGIDIQAHQSALENDLITVAVMGTSFKQIYPSVHRKYYEQILENGAVLSEYFSSDKPDRNYFLQRNRIIAGMSQATIVVESGLKGGALVTAEMAFTYNREVYALPGRVTDNFSKGCNMLINKNIAKILISTEQITGDLQWEINEPKHQPRPVQKQLFVNLSEDEQTIVSLLEDNGKMHLDDMAIALHMSISKLARHLVILELNGVVKTLPGKYYELA